MIYWRSQINRLVEFPVSLSLRFLKESCDLFLYLFYSLWTGTRMTWSDLGHTFFVRISDAAFFMSHHIGWLGEWQPDPSVHRVCVFPFMTIGVTHGLTLWHPVTIRFCSYISCNGFSIYWYLLAGSILSFQCQWNGHFQVLSFLLQLLAGICLCRRTFPHQLGQVGYSEVQFVKGRQNKRFFPFL